MKAFLKHTVRKIIYDDDDQRFDFGRFSIW
jgi:hypothetical protein